MATKKTTTKKAPAKAKTPKAPKAKAEAMKISPEESQTVSKPAKAAKKTESAARKGQYFYAAGKRKTAIASVRMYVDGAGVITINGRTFENYFPVFSDQDKIISPLRMTSNQKSFDVVVHVAGGGIHAQADAIRHGISKALLDYNVGLRTTLKTAGFLTRDSRIKERKKYGLHRARRAPQFSKR